MRLFFVQQKRQGFTLLELLVVIAILATLLGLLLPAVQQVRATALRQSCANNLRQIGLALHHYHDTATLFPPGMVNGNPAIPYRYLSWHARLLPYLEQSALWNKIPEAFRADPDAFHQPPHTAAQTVVPVFTCPMDARLIYAYRIRQGIHAHTSYLGNSGLDYTKRDGILFLNSQVRLTAVTDGTSNTLLVGERPPSADLRFGWWYAGVGQRLSGSIDTHLGVRERKAFSRSTSGTYGPCPVGPYSLQPGTLDNPCDVFHYWSLHRSGTHFLFADGGVRLLDYSADSVLPQLATRAGGEVVSFP